MSTPSPTPADMPAEPAPIDEGRIALLLRRYGLALTRLRTPVQAGADALAWMVGLLLAQFIRFDFRLTGSRFTVGDLIGIAVIAGTLQIVIGLWCGLYRNRWRYGSIDEVGHLLQAVFIVGASILVGDTLVGSRLVPISVPVGGAVAAMAIMGGIRYFWRIVTEFANRPTRATARAVLVVGAGEAGDQIVTAMMRATDSPYLPVGFLDDDPGKSRLVIKGVPVLGIPADLARVAAMVDVDAVVVAVPGASRTLLRLVADQALEAGIAVRIIPPLLDVLSGQVSIDAIRPLTEADLLGRPEATIDLDAISGYLTNRRVLVTGAGGSIGSELCRQIATFDPAELIMVDRDESGLHGTQLMIHGRALLDDPGLVVADIRDRDRIMSLFAERQPEVVFHAAALKHLTLLERHPAEALKTNVVGTQNVLDAALACGVRRFVNVSTDKAADASSVLGHTKRIAERLTATAATVDAGVYLSVRFGNVLGSRGSVLTAFRAQIEAGGPVTVTHQRVTRYFMTVEEAVQLLIQAGAIGTDGDALVLDMGEPIRIDDVARRLIAEAAASGKLTGPIEIEYTGLRPGEKLDEVLFGGAEEMLLTSHDLITRVAVPPLGFDTVAANTVGMSDTVLISRLAMLSRLESDGVPAAD
jgi:FlaA1/EpsC-like NDP-sugar epimerase